jgi:hypothetical protein
MDGLDPSDEIHCTNWRIFLDKAVASRLETCPPVIRHTLDHPVNQQAVPSAKKDNVTHVDLVHRNRCHLDHVSIPEKRVHALATHLPTKRGT